MNNKVLEYFNRIKELSDEENIIQKEIDDKRHEFEEEVIEPLQSKLEEKSAEHIEIENKYVSADLSRVVEEVANIWGVDAKDIDVQYFTDVCQAYIHNPSDYLGSVINSNFKKGLYDNAYYNYTVRLVNNDKKLNFVCPLDRNAIQADGKTLVEHIHYEMMESKSGPYYDFKIDDISTLRMYFKVKNLLKANDDRTQAIINACEEKAIDQSTELAD